MTLNFRIRGATASDLEAMKSVIDSTQLFPSELLDEMVMPHLRGERPGEKWLVLEHDGQPAGLAYCAPERLTAGTRNLLLIAVHQAIQGNGGGTRLLLQLEHVLKQDSNRILIVETSSLPEYQAARRFYERNGYVEEARIRDFYQDQEDKIVFWKRLQD